VDLGVIVQKMRNAIQAIFDFVVARTRGRARYHPDRTGEFIDDPVIEFVEQERLVGEYDLRGEDCHRGLLLGFAITVNRPTRGATCPASRTRRPSSQHIRNRSKENALRIALATERNSAMRRGGLADLNAFLTVADHLRFRAASAQLGVTASALIHTMYQLEERLGMRLLHRRTRNVSLAAG
jgi:hypothetical protein